MKEVMDTQMLELDGKQLDADFRSGDPVRVAGALEKLDQAWRRRCFDPVPMPEPECLEAFGNVVPDVMLVQYLRSVENYHFFAPPPSVRERRCALVEAMVRYGRGERTFDVALALKIDDDPDFAVADALDYLRDRGLENSDEILATHRLIDYLLDSDKTRLATIEVLRNWAMAERYPHIIEMVRPRLSDAERLRLDVNDE